MNKIRLIGLLLLLGAAGPGGAMAADLPAITQAGPTMPDPTHNWQFAVSPVMPDGKVYLFGAGNLWVGCDHSDAIRVFDTATSTWSTLATRLPYAYLTNEPNSAALASNGRIYIGPGNGCGGWGSHNRIIEFDPATGLAVEKAELAAGSVWGMSMAAAGNGVYLFGGWNGGGLGEVRFYDPATDTVQVVASLSAGRSVRGVISHPNGRIYLFSGNTSGTFDIIEKFDPATNTLTRLPNPGPFLSIPLPLWLGPDQLIHILNPDIPSLLGGYASKVYSFDPVTETVSFEGLNPSTHDYFFNAAQPADRTAVFFFASMNKDETATAAAFRMSLEYLVPDTKPPVLQLPASFEDDATSPDGAAVTFAATATDDVDGTVPVTCSPASGALFPVGPTNVACSAVDAAGNRASGSFTVTVRPFGPPPVTVVVLDSAGAGIAGANVTYYKTSWQPFGATGADGRASLALPPGTYSFRVEVGGGSVQKSQNTAANPDVTFQTVSVVVRLRNSAGNPLDTGTADYYALSWRSFGVTSGGEVRREMLPTSYSFAMTYLGGRVQLAQNVALDPVVTFQTREVTVTLRSSTSLPLDGGTVQYYAQSWRPFGTTVGGEVRKELLPTAYSFATTWAGGRTQLTQNVASSPAVDFRTGSVVSDSGSCTSYYATSWKPYFQGIELLPGTYPFRFGSGTPAQESLAIEAGMENHIR